MAMMQFQYRRPIYDGDKVQEAVLDRHKGDICAPNLIGAVNLPLPQQIRIDRMLGVRLAGSRTLVDRFQAHLRHEATDAMATNNDPFPAQIGRDLA